MVDLVVQNIVTWFFSFVTFGSYGIFFILELFYKNGFHFVFDRTHYILEIVSILLQIIVFPVMIFFILKDKVIHLFVWFLLMFSLVLVLVSSIVESLSI